MSCFKIDSIDSVNIQYSSEWMSLEKIIKICSWPSCMRTTIVPVSLLLFWITYYRWLEKYLEPKILTERWEQHFLWNTAKIGSNQVAIVLYWKYFASLWSLVFLSKRLIIGIRNLSSVCRINRKYHFGFSYLSKRIFIRNHCVRRRMPSHLKILIER